jgi:tetratricopeptide (TPR) repeat protein
MKNKFTYPIILIVFAISIGVVFFRYTTKEKAKENVVYGLIERKGPAAKSAEWKTTQQRAATLLQQIANNKENNKPKLQLASLYIQEARATGNYVYYDAAAMKYVNDVLKKEPANFDALTLKALLHLSQHHFAEAVAVATEAKNINQYNAFVYGLLVDGYVEMGQYDSAVANCDKMMNIRPDIRSYSRVAYLREIYGDYPGAIEAMKMACESGVAGDENTEWCRVQLGHLYENTGDNRTALMHYTIAAENRLGYAPALAALARVATVNKEYAKAIAYLQKADSVTVDPSLQQQMAEVYEAAGNKIKASASAKKVLKKMMDAGANEKQIDSAGHYSDRELAYAYLAVNNNEKALEHALLEYNRRPDNIDVNETLAWVYYKQNETAKAFNHIKVAMKTNSVNPVLMCRAALIFNKSGDSDMAKKLLSAVFKTNANLPVGLKTELQTAMNSLQLQ